MTEFFKTAPHPDHDNQPRVVSGQKARQGRTSGRVRLVLQASLALAFVAGVTLWLIYFS